MKNTKQAILESKRDEITGFLLGPYRTKKTSLYIVDSVAEYLAEQFDEVTCMGQANTSSLCKKLERGGFLTRSRSAADGRVVTLSLTSRGRETAERIQQGLDRYLELLNALPDRTRDELRRGFEAANEMLDYLLQQTKGDQNLC